MLTAIEVGLSKSASLSPHEEKSKAARIIVTVPDIFFVIRRTANSVRD
jgi:hypothetical protein